MRLRSCKIPNQMKHLLIQINSDANYLYMRNSKKAKKPNTTYTAVSVIGRNYNLYYSVWCNKEHEL